MQDILETRARLARLENQQKKSSLWHRLFRIH
jgi:hypothetical protein